MVVAQSQAACRSPEFPRLFFSHGARRRVTSELRGLETDLPRLLCRRQRDSCPHADDLRLRRGAGHGAIVERRALDCEARERRRAASGIYGTTAQIANAAVFFAIESSQSSQLALLAACALFALSIIACAAFLTRMRRVTG
ncbi:hypothetical protein IVB22_36275 [Bradyrhizobium sp. 190]|uniref:hypothetical protein n=1 Tax=Bradyrhizobium sp. 190 TaxID=2782658 RepID=UPI0027DF5C25|nr:hypothetical protein [Bradyrhizobium sp. 190]MCK1517850.1 hypothetical protein [Bradyrhizobium sp. 190]